MDLFSLTDGTSVNTFNASTNMRYETKKYTGMCVADAATREHQIARGHFLDFGNQISPEIQGGPLRAWPMGRPILLLCRPGRLRRHGVCSDECLAGVRGSSAGGGLLMKESKREKKKGRERDSKRRKLGAQMMGKEENG